MQPGGRAWLSENKKEKSVRRARVVDVPTYGVGDQDTKVWKIHSWEFGVESGDAVGI